MQITHLTSATKPAAKPQSGGPLTEEHRYELAAATNRLAPIRNAARVATTNAWITGVIAALSWPFAMFSVAGFLVAVGLTIVTYNEFNGRRRLLEFDPSAATSLARNQIGFLALIVVYCLWSIYSGLTGDNPIAAALSANSDLLAAEDRQMLAAGGDLWKIFVVGFYGTVILLSVIFQGANALYYATRRKYVQRYIDETPEWIRDLQRTTLPV